MNGWQLVFQVNTLLWNTTASYTFKETVCIYSLSVFYLLSSLYSLWQIFPPSLTAAGWYILECQTDLKSFFTLGKVFILTQRWFDREFHTLVSLFSVKHKMPVCDDVDDVDGDGSVYVSISHEGWKGSIPTHNPQTGSIISVSLKIWMWAYVPYGHPSIEPSVPSSHPSTHPSIHPSIIC